MVPRVRRHLEWLELSPPCLPRQRGAQGRALRAVAVPADVSGICVDSDRQHVLDVAVRHLLPQCAISSTRSLARVFRLVYGQAASMSPWYGDELRVVFTFLYAVVVLSQVRSRNTARRERRFEGAHICQHACMLVAQIIIGLAGNVNTSQVLATSFVAVSSCAYCLAYISPTPHSRTILASRYSTP